MSDPAMACRELVELVSDYLEGALDAGTRVRLEAHLAECGHCEAYLAQLRTSIRLSGGLASDEVPPAVLEALLRVFRDEARSGP